MGVKSSNGGFLDDGTPGAVGMRSSASGQNLDVLEAPFCAKHSPQAGDGQVMCDLILLIEFRLKTIFLLTGMGRARKRRAIADCGHKSSGVGTQFEKGMQAQFPRSI